MTKESQMPKVLQMFEAVIALIEEGADINTIKVSDITTRAGIGKGTAYEYFKTKEEIIVNAILYDVENTTRQVEEEFRHCSGFADKFRCILEWVDKNFSSNHSISPFLNMYQGSYQVSAAIKEEMCRHFEAIEYMVDRSNRLIEEGKEEGILRTDLPTEMLTSVLLSHISAYILFLNRLKVKGGMDQEQMKKFLGESVIKGMS